ncbi:MAG: biotin transporter BioY [Candidatus Accumulibacter sp.]|jgi:biotin transport system substrate-specific component|nr:biotin transporter BioY [Accumulibacter sp.]
MNNPAFPLVSVHRHPAWIVLMATLTAVGGMIAIPVTPLSPVPITLQTLFVLLAGLILGPRDGALAMLLYLLAGILGLPVFAGGKAGLAALMGPTGGFLTGFVPAAMFCGLARRDPARSFPVLLGYCLLATALTLLPGTIQLSVVLKISIAKAFAVGSLPFLPGALLKSAGAAFIYRFLVSRKLIPI